MERICAVHIWCKIDFSRFNSPILLAVARFKCVRHVADFPTFFGLYLLDDFVTSIFLIQIWAHTEIKKCEVIRSISRHRMFCSFLSERRNSAFFAFSTLSIPLRLVCEHTLLNFSLSSDWIIYFFWAKSRLNEWMLVGLLWPGQLKRGAYVLNYVWNNKLHTKVCSVHAGRPVKCTQAKILIIGQWLPMILFSVSFVVAKCTPFPSGRHDSVQALLSTINIVQLHCDVKRISSQLKPFFSLERTYN